MTVHDWQLVEAGIFHDFHHAWVEDIKRSLNSSLLSSNYYALAKQFAGGFGPDVLTLQSVVPVDEIAGEQQKPPPDKPLTQVAYESALTIKAYSVPLAVGDSLTDMPVFLEPNAQVPVPLDDTYERAFAALPRRWQKVLQPAQAMS